MKIGAFLSAFVFTLSVLQGAGIVINEIMFHPPGDADELQFIELHNAGTGSVDLSGWKFSRGVDFEFPAGTRMDAGSFCVLCKDSAAFKAHYGGGPKVLGAFSGKLSHRGEKLELVDGKGAVIDSVTFKASAPWPTGADGASGSLERICPQEASNDPYNWVSSKLPEIEKASGSPGARNEAYSKVPIPRCTLVTHSAPQPNVPSTVTVNVSHPAGVTAVTLSWWTNAGRQPGNWIQVKMNRSTDDKSSGTYTATIPGQEPGRLVRYIIRAEGADGTIRLMPSPNELRPAFSYATSPGPNTATVPFLHLLTLGARGRQGPSLYNQGGRERESQSSPSRGTSAAIIVKPGGSEVELFDFVKTRPRPNGFKLNFWNDQKWDGLDNVNVIYETGRSALSEPLSFELYRRCGVPAPETRHARVWVDGRALGYQLVIEQPNKAFLRRTHLDPSGNLYKLLWYENGPIRQHEKKTNLRTGHADLQQALSGLAARSASGQWDYIRNNFNVEEFASYYAVNMCIQNWDGFFNNYFVHHDLSRNGKWTIIPWDEDKTWGEYDGGPRDYSWYEMPLTMGMNGDKPVQGRFSFGGGGGPFGGESWWRPGGWFAGPLLAHAEFRKQFLARLRNITDTEFVPEKINPLVAELEQRLEPEIVYRARLNNEKPDEALKRFRNNLQSFRNQAIHRRRFILQRLMEGRN